MFGRQGIAWTVFHASSLATDSVCKNKRFARTASSWSEKNNTTKGRLLFILLDMKNYYYIVIF